MLYSYLDNNATTRPVPEVIAAMLECLEHGWGNPASLHAAGQDAARRLDLAREQVAALLHAAPEEIVFTSGGTEGCNHILHALVRPGEHVITSAIEHRAILAPCARLEACGVRISRVPVTADGVVDLAQLAAAITPETRLISIMLANNETGVLQPLQEVVEMARRLGILVHTDATQAVGKIPVDVRALGCDCLTLSAHKFHGPKGVGALHVRDGLKLSPFICGGGQEMERRGGTENVPGIAGLGVAAELARQALPVAVARMEFLRNGLERELLRLFPGAGINGARAPRLPNTTSITLPGRDNAALAMKLDLTGIAVGTGSACTSASRAPSHVLTAMGLSPEQARNTLRFSLSRLSTEAEIDAALRGSNIQ